MESTVGKNTTARNSDFCKTAWNVEIVCIIIAVIIGTIIEMLLPKNKNSKYIKVVIGMFVLFTIFAMNQINNN